MSYSNVASSSQPSSDFELSVAKGDYRVHRCAQRAQMQREAIEALRRQGRSTLTAEILLAQYLQEVARLTRAAH